jgi:tRNA (cmo5U34)-methyltransferase
MEETTNQSTKTLYENYDNLIIKCVPNYHKILQIITECIDTDKYEILDIGIGTGNLEEFIFNKFPQAKIVGIDTSADFLNIAKNKNINYQLQTVQADIRNYDIGEHKFDIILSSLAIHHFEDNEKYILFQGIYKALSDNGIFINFDMIKPETEEEYLKLSDQLFERWKEHGLSNDFIEEEKKEMAERDRLVELSKQKKWLEKIGFNFEIIFKDGLFCIYKCKKAIYVNPRH